MASALVKLAQDQVIATRIIHYLKLDRFSRFTRVALIIIAFLLFDLVRLVVRRFADVGWGTARANVGVALIACLIIYSIEIVDYLHSAYLNQTAGDLFRAAENRDVANQFSDWFRKLFSKGWQRLCAWTGGVLGAASLFWYSMPTNMPDRATDVLLGFALGFVGVHGVSFGIRIPTLACLVSKQRMPLDSFRPGETPWIRNLSKMFAAMCLGLFVGALLCFPGAWFLMPQNATHARAAWTLWLLFAGPVILMSFFAPQWALSRMIREKKRSDSKLILAALRDSGAQLFASVPYLGRNPQAAALFSAYETVCAAPSTPIDAAQLLKVAVPIAGYLSACLSWVYSHWAEVSNAWHWLIGRP